MGGFFCSPDGKFWGGGGFFFAEKLMLPDYFGIFGIFVVTPLFFVTKVLDSGDCTKLWQHNRGNYTAPTIYQKKKCYSSWIVGKKDGLDWAATLKPKQIIKKIRTLMAWPNEGGCTKCAISTAHTVIFFSSSR